MRVASIGGGPAGLYFSILFKKRHPEAVIDVYERNKPDDTFGWGVVFSDETLGGFEAADPETYAEIRRHFATWSDIETWLDHGREKGEPVRSSGHGFCGLSRKRLLEIFHARARELGVRLHFEHELEDERDVGSADLVLAVDGINSFVRTRHAAHFRPTLDWRRCKFAWFGTTLPLEAFTFIFRASEHGLFQIHAYPFQRGAETLSTFIVECHEDVWKKAGFEQASEQDAVRYLEDLFAEHLRGHRLLTNRSLWRTFPVIRCGTWVKGNLVLMGDAAHTAHFSIGSGTKLAMEDAIELDRALGEAGVDDVPAALALYEQRRQPEVARLQRAAETSMEWFEHTARYVDQDPVTFTFNLMTRSKRITYDNLALRDPALVLRTAEVFANEQGLAVGERVPAPIFVPLALRDCVLPNRIAVSPMCQYRASEGRVDDWHLVHLGSRALGGAGLVMTEMTDVAPEGRITLGCAGLWNDAHEAAWKRVVEFVHAESAAKIGIQLAHAGRKGSCELPWEGDTPLRDARAWTTLAPSAAPFGDGWPVPHAMTRADLERVREAFVAATLRALRAGFDLVELHMAHGYLLSSFLSPAANARTDEYGGSLTKRMRYPLEVLDAVRAVWPSEKPLAVRISASDWLPAGEGQTLEESIELARTLHAHGCDLVDVSSAGNTPRSKVVHGRMYQVPFADAIRHAVPGLRVMAVGAIRNADHANTILAAGRADLCALARAHLSDPYLTLHAAEHYGHFEQPWPKPYLAVKPRPTSRPG